MPVLLVLAIVVLVGGWLWYRWVNVLATLDVQDGRVSDSAGVLRPRVLHDIADACRLSGFRDGAIVLHRGGGVVTYPSDEGLEQRIRNVVGTRGVMRETRGDDVIGVTNRVGGWLALNGVIAMLLRRFR
ncbi:MAG: hypothetical protein R3F61_23965 [Myxococcota bacterium]